MPAIVKTTWVLIVLLLFGYGSPLVQAQTKQPDPLLYDQGISIEVLRYRIYPLQANELQSVSRYWLDSLQQ